MSRTFCLNTDNISTIEASKNEFRKTLCQKQYDNTIQDMAFASGPLINAERKCLIGELHSSAFLWG